MKPAPQLKQWVEEIARKHEFDLYQFGAYLNLALNGDRLIIKNVGNHRLSITYLLWLFDEWSADPEIVVWTNYHPTWSSEQKESNPWVLIEIFEMKGGWKVCGDIDADGNLVAFHHHERQAWLTEFTETVVVPTLMSQGWLEKGVRLDEPPPTYTLEQMPDHSHLPEKTYPINEEVDNDIPF